METYGPRVIGVHGNLGPGFVSGGNLSAMESLVGMTAKLVSIVLATSRSSCSPSEARIHG